MLLYIKIYINYNVGLVNAFGFTGLPGARNSLFSFIRLILGLPLLRFGGVVEDVSSPLFDDDIGFLPGFNFTTFTRDNMYLSLW